MTEYAEILAHNVLDGATIIANSASGYEPEKMRDGHRHTWWQAPSTATQFIKIVCANLLDNGDFETNLDGWDDLATGGGAGTFARNTSSPLIGNADALCTVTTANDSSSIYLIYVFKPFLARANRTYRMMFRASHQGAGSKYVRFGFVKDGAIEDSDYYSVPTGILTTGSNCKIDVTPTSDIWLRPYIRFLEAQTTQIDEVYVNEVRAVDTIIIDAGHTLAMGNIQVWYSAGPAPMGWTEALSITTWNDDAPVYITFTGVKALRWRIRLAVTAYYGSPPAIKIPQLYLGKRWTMPHYFSGRFDPHEQKRFDNVFTGQRGIVQRTLKYNQRIFRASMSHMSSSDYENAKMFFEDTDNGLKPFFFVYQPTSDLNDVMFMRLKGARKLPYQGGTLRNWGFDAEEVVGRRVI